MLSRWKKTNRISGTFHSYFCHPERSEGSHDCNARLLPTRVIKVFL